MFTINSNLGFHAPPASEPLVMVAAGSGVSPFMGFIQERIAKKSSSETILLWSIPYLREGWHILEDLESMLEGPNINISIIVSVSREDKWPVLRDGKFHMESKHRMRITEFLERSRSLRKRMHQLLLPQKFGGSGGFNYLCGSASFVRSTLDVVSEILSDMSLFQDSTARNKLLSDICAKHSEQWLIEQLQSDQKIIYEVFNDKSSKDPPTFKISELVTRNNPTNRHTQGMWMSIYEEVYDITNFVHPGGERILHSYSGMDATVAWEAVRHHRSQSLNAKLATLHIGKLRIPTFAPLPLMSLDDNTSTDLNGVFRAWRKFMFDVVEVENAMMMEYSLDTLHIAGDSNAKDMTPMKIQMLFQAHRRFVFTHLGGTLKDSKANAMKYQKALKRPAHYNVEFERGCGLEVDLDEDEGMYPSSHETVMQKLLDSKDSLKVLASCDLFVRMCHDINTIYHGDDEMMHYMINSADAMKTHDLRLIYKMKDALRMVMRSFEERDGLFISPPTLYFELQKAADTIMYDWEAYVKKISSPLIIKKLWDKMGISDEYLATYNANDWLNLTKPTLSSQTVAGWQSGVKKT